MASARKFLYQRLNPALVRLYNILRRLKPVEMALDLLLTRLFPDIGIPFLEATRSTGSMEGDWDNRAKLDALLAATGEATETEAEASALKALETHILKGVPLDRTSTVLEIGCGIGNLLKPLSAQVKEAHGVDISGEMLRQAAGHTKGCPNVVLHKTEGRLDMFPDSFFDFVFSSGVFIHFPEKPLVYDYFKEAARVLKPGGVFRFHVDGRSHLAWRSKKGGTLRGVVFTSEELRENLGMYRFQVQDMTGAGSLDMWTTAVVDKG
ncbi:MAG TPA: class I SAM-dependent methyltransferase [Dehalococcoidia bacterium]|nr:class I SAM-dependent methyltransferase [Dehalococcoidia bacterium]